MGIMRLRAEKTGVITVDDAPLFTGGEATIRRLPDDDTRLMKDYFHPKAEHAEKLAAMIRIACQGILPPAGLAFPQERVFDGDRFRGFLMPKVDARELHMVIDESTRRQFFPTFGGRQLVHAAHSLAKAASAVHRLTFVIGDGLTQRNALINSSAEITLIDCDSYQVEIAGKLYPCPPVGVPEYLPPELQGPVASLSVRRTQEQDRFGLAVLIFQILTGKHPFAGVYVGQGTAPALPERIRLGHWPYERGTPYQPPPDVAPLRQVPADIRLLFRRAFVDGHKNPLLRPTADEWRHALADAEADGWEPVAPGRQQVAAGAICWPAVGQVLLRPLAALCSVVGLLPRKVWLVTGCLALLVAASIVLYRYWPATQTEPAPAAAKEEALPPGVPSPQIWKSLKNPKAPR